MPFEGRDASLLRLAIGTWTAEPNGTLRDADPTARALLDLSAGARPEWLQSLLTRLGDASIASSEIEGPRGRATVVAYRRRDRIEGLVQDAEAHFGSEPRFRHIYENAPVAMHSIDEQSRICDVNREWLALTGYARDEVIGRNASFLMTNASAERALAEVIPRLWRQSRVRGEPFEYVRKDGCVIEVEIDCDSTIDPAGRRVSLSVVRDVTERNRVMRALQQRERDLRTLIERSPDAVLLHRDGTILYANSRAASLLGAPSAAELQGRPLPQGLHRIDAVPSDARVVEARIERADGAERVVEVARLSLYVDEVATEALLARDITERRQLQARLAQTDRLATVGTLAAGVAHEVNNPLMYVMHSLAHVTTELEALGDRLADRPEVVETIRRLAVNTRTASEGALRVREIVRDLKTFARVEQSSKVPLDVNRALRSAIQLAGHQIQMRARLNVEVGALPIVRANDGRLCQVFLNLLLNAAQAIPPSAIDEHAVRVSSWSDGANVYVSVKDSGTGIDPRDLGRLFEPFFSTKPSTVGSGLGLWICREIVHEHGGHLEVESQPGTGSTFTVVLPAASPREPLAPVSSLPPPPGALVELRASEPPPRILVIDDEAALRDLLAEALGEQAHVLTASSGDDACELLRHDDAFDVILCDLVMPGMSGVELYGWVQEQAPELAQRIVFMTGGAFSPQAREFLRKVSNERLSKPFRVRDVERVIATLVAPARMQ